MAQPHRQLRMEQKNAPRWGAFFQAVKKAFGFFDSLKNAVIFAPENGAKIFALLNARLAKQGLARHLI